VSYAAQSRRTFRVLDDAGVCQTARATGLVMMDRRQAGQTAKTISAMGSRMTCWCPKYFDGVGVCYHVTVDVRFRHTPDST
jgi:hypothetical protein